MKTITEILYGTKKKKKKEWEILKCNSITWPLTSSMCSLSLGQRRIEPSAMMLAVYQNNPNASWEVKCDHRNGIKQYQTDR